MRTRGGRRKIKRERNIGKRRDRDRVREVFISSEGIYHYETRLSTIYTIRFIIMRTFFVFSNGILIKTTFHRNEIILLY